jgi:excisionase family DNA binding protein
MNQMLDVKKAAEITGLSISWWRKAIQRGAVPFSKIGRRVLIEESDIRRLVINSRVEPRSSEDSR